MPSRYRREKSVALAIAALAVIAAFAAPGFFTLSNQRDVLMANMPALITALGMTLVILTGQIDISVGSQFAICGVAAGLLAKTGLPLIAVGLAVLLVGAILGAINGALVAYVRIPSIVVTLAAMVALRDGLRWTTEGAWVEDLPRNFQWFGLSLEASEGVTVSIAVALLAGTAWCLRNLAAGRAVYAVGSNPDAAYLAGIDARRVTFWVFGAAGALTGGAALLNAARFNQIPSNAGLGMEMKVIAAVVVGGAEIRGGRGTIVGTLLGVVLLGAIGPVLTFLGVSAYWEKAIQGAIILGAVGAEAWPAKWRAGRGRLGYTPA
ncbi:MAG TPA: ABC transporter permease [Bryobacteraceae bacterium]|jgi:rhamnose transport system permease protein